MEVSGRAIPGGEHRGANRAGALPLRSKHGTVDEQRLLVAEDVAQPHGSCFTDQLVVLRNLSPGRQGPALGGHALDMAAEFNLFREQGGAGGAVFRALVWKSCFVLCRPVFCRDQNFFVSHFARFNGGIYTVSIVLDREVFTQGSLPSLRGSVPYFRAYPGLTSWALF